MLRAVKVSGHSLTPGYQEGDFVVVVKIPLFLRPYRTGDIVVFKHPLYGMVIKQVQKVLPESREIIVAGTHPDSLKSYHLGPISQQAVLGKVIWHIRKPTAG